MFCTLVIGIHSPAKYGISGLCDLPIHNLDKNEMIVAETYMTIDADPVCMGLATRRTLDLESVVVWAISSISRGKVSHSSSHQRELAFSGAVRTH